MIRDTKIEIKIVGNTDRRMTTMTKNAEIGMWKMIRRHKDRDVKDEKKLTNRYDNRQSGKLKIMRGL